MTKAEFNERTQYFTGEIPIRIDFQGQLVDFLIKWDTSNGNGFLRLVPLLPIDNILKK